MQKILSKMRKAIEDYDMINDGDKIAVALSGGKDSITLLKGLKALQRFYPKSFNLIAISVNPGFEFFDTSFLENTCKEIGVEFVEARSDIKEIVFDIRNPFLNILCFFFADSPISFSSVLNSFIK